MANNERKNKTEQQVTEVEISTTLYSINYCQNWKFPKE